MRVVFYGTGGVGGNFGGYMARAGIDVTFIARGAHLRAMQEQGLNWNRPQGDFFIKPVKATDDPAKAGKADVIFICLKAWQLEEAVGKISPMVGPDTMVISIQNWIEAPDFLISHLGPGHVLGGVCYTSSSVVRPGVVHADGGKITFGELDRKPSTRAKILEGLFARVPGISGQNSPDIHKQMWNKFVWISSVGALGASTGAAIGVWRKQPEKRALFKTVLREALAVAKAKGARFTWWNFYRMEKSIDGMPENFKTSMQHDMEAGTRSELQYQIGAIVRLGKAANVPVPASDAIYNSLLPSELRAQAQMANVRSAT